jgi:hypothetical protein
VIDVNLVLVALFANAERLTKVSAPAGEAGAYGLERGLLTRDQVDFDKLPDFQILQGQQKRRFWATFYWKPT